jgi:hydroxymethylbilane synthase
VHSLKDLPVENVEGLTVACTPLRGEVRDALISTDRFTLATLPPNAVVGTSSLRRGAQLLAVRPDLKIESLRGNVDTRLRKAGEGRYDAIVLAGAGLTRLGLGAHISEWLPLDVMLPAPGQGALAVQCRADDPTTLDLLAGLDDPATRRAVTAERAFLSGLGGGCAVPVAAYAEAVFRPPASGVRLQGLVASPDGQKLIRLTAEGTDALAVGKELALQALAQGAEEILMSTGVK